MADNERRDPDQLLAIVDLQLSGELPQLNRSDEDDQSPTFN